MEKRAPHPLETSPHGASRGDDCLVGLVLTGGTIGAEEEGSVLSVGAEATQAEVSLLTSVWPGDAAPTVETETPLRELSENLRPRDWVTIAAAVRRLAEKHVSGVVVLHGTDTMPYTAAALSFLLSDLDLPIILTGSNLPSGEAGSDAAANVRAALVAMRELTAGTYVAFAGDVDATHGNVYLGTKVRKRRASGDAFLSINRKPVGVVEDTHFEHGQRHYPAQREKSTQAVDEHVMALRLYPGLNFDVAFEAVVAGDVHGVLIELYASATGPDTGDSYSLPRFIQRCAARGIVVATAIAEAPERNGKTYETTVAITEAGGLFLHDMLPETATVKLMWALAQSKDPARVKNLLLTPIAGELENA